MQANPNGQRGGQGTPGHLSAWSKIDLGWITPTEITTDGTYRLAPQETTPQVFKISQGYQSNEYLLLENRQPIPQDFDEDFYEPGGVMIYHVDENVGPVAFNEPGGHPDQAGWPQNGNHYPVALLQRDGNYDLEKGNNNGDEGDIYSSPEHELSPTSGFPNTDSYALGQVSSTGITITNFQFVDGTDPREITFDVIGLQQVTTPETPAPSTNPSSTPSNLSTEVPSSVPSVPPTLSEGTPVPSSVPSVAPSTGGIVESEVPVTFNPLSEAPTIAFPNATATPNATSVPTPSPNATSVPTVAPNATTSPTRGLFFPPSLTGPITLPPFSIPPVPVGPPNIPVKPRPQNLVDFPFKRPPGDTAPTGIITPPTLPPYPPPVVQPVVPRPTGGYPYYYYYSCSGGGKGGKGGSKGGYSDDEKCKKKMKRIKKPPMPSKQAFKFDTKGSSKDSGGGTGGSNSKGSIPDSSFYNFHTNRKGPPRMNQP